MKYLAINERQLSTIRYFFAISIEKQDGINYPLIQVLTNENENEKINLSGREQELCSIENLFNIIPHMADGHAKLGIRNTSQDHFDEKLSDEEEMFAKELFGQNPEVVVLVFSHHDGMCLIPCHRELVEAPASALENDVIRIVEEACEIISTGVDGAVQYIFPKRHPTTSIIK